MKVYIVEDYRQLSIQAAAIIAGQVNLKPNAVLGLATGSTQEGMYSELVQLYRDKKVNFSEVLTFNLDEYVGLDPEHPQSYHYFMRHHLFNHINVPAERINIPSANASDIDEFCREYDRRIAAAGGIDLQVLGIGVNGHIGFNEPGDDLNVGTHMVNLAEDTITANSRFFNSAEEVPRQAITMGMGSIMKARRLLLLASGKSKAEAIKATVSGKVTTQVPASFLQLHRRAIIIADREAASLL